jgi:hypothetical protein
MLKKAKPCLGWCDKNLQPRWELYFAKKSCCPALLSVKKIVQLCLPYRVTYHVQLEEIAETDRLRV